MTDLTYMLVIDVVGPSGYRDQIVIKDPNPDAMKPRLGELGGISYERYQGDDDDCFVEIRLDWIASRTLHRLEPEIEPPLVSEPGELDVPDAPMHPPRQETER